MESQTRPAAAEQSLDPADHTSFIIIIIIIVRRSQLTSIRHTSTADIPDNTLTLLINYRQNAIVNFEILFSVLTN